MKPEKRSERIREALRNHPTGLTAKALGQLTEIDQANVTHVLKSMPDAYIKAWVRHEKRNSAVAKWACVFPPANAQRP